MSKGKITVPAPTDAHSPSKPPEADKISRAIPATPRSSPGRKIVVAAPESSKPATGSARAADYAEPKRKIVVSPDPVPDGADQAPSRKRRGKLFKVAMALLIVVLLFAGYLTAVGIRTSMATKRTGPEVLSALSKDPGPTNILLSGSDTRTGANSVVAGESKPGLADVIMILQIRSTSTKILSIPRDTRVRLPGYGEQKINAALPLGGAPMMVNAVKNLTGLPIHHYAEIDFEGFLAITDAVGGVELCLDTAERDSFSGLDLQAGCQHVGGEQALAYVRSRHTELLQGGRWIADPEGDIGRIKRQQKFMGALMKKVRNPVTATVSAWDLGPAIASAFKIDPSFGLGTTARAGIAMSGGSESMELMSLPTVPANTRGIAFLDLKQPEASEVLAKMRA